MKLDKSEIIRILNERDVNKPCTRCGNNQFTLLDGYVKLSVYDEIEDMNNVKIGGPSVPAIMTACSKCGAITFHALGALGLLQNGKESSDAK